MASKRSLSLMAVSAMVALALTPSVLTQQPSPPAQGGRGGTPAPQVVSPEVMPDRTIVFRILAPQAQSVRVTGGDIPALAGGGRGAATGSSTPGQMT